jgi:formate dehydrogenase subunit beta
MEHVVRAVDVRETGAVAAVQELLWRLMERDIVQGLLVPLQTHPHEAPAPTLIKNRERLSKANPLAPVMTLNTAKIVGMLLAQESGKRLAAVMRPCEARALGEFAEGSQVRMEALVMVSIDCLGSHDESDFEQRSALWGTEVPTRESLRWSRRGQIAPYRFREACQICEQPYYDGADIVIGLLGQNVKDEILVFVNRDLAGKIGLDDSISNPPGTEEKLWSRQQTIIDLVTHRKRARERLLGEMHNKVTELADLMALFSSCTLCGECLDACPLTPKSDFGMDDYQDNTREYVAKRLLDIASRSESCAGCGMCQAACQIGIPLLLVTQMIAERADVRSTIIAAFADGSV